jgi:sterol desaturase/sphingolipid hydroxylase (fatty acid hydroxylase superfamily)
MKTPTLDILLHISCTERDNTMDYWDIFKSGYQNYANYLWQELTNPSWHNYLYWLIAISLFFLLLEWWKPWRKEQAKFRKDFWLDFFYMFFNFFLFSLLIYNAASDVVVTFFNTTIQHITGLDVQASNPLQQAPLWTVLLVGFVVRDFVQWWIHRLLHRVPRLWEFHKVHHSVQEMGFAAHLRYHWMENVVYRTLEYIPLALLGIGLYDFFIIHIFTLAVGHFNHSNLSVSPKIKGGVIGLFLGVIIATGAFEINLLTAPSLVKQLLIVVASTGVGIVFFSRFVNYLFNSPEMHIWHHAYELPDSHPHGINFGLTLAIWDYLWGTAHIPHSGQNIRLGFEGVEEFPEGFIQQNLHGVTR